MVIYYAFALLELVLVGLAGWASRLGPPERSRKLNFYDYLAILALVAFAGLRYYTGSDYGRYLAVFTDIQNQLAAGTFSLGALSGTEPGYLLLNWLTALVFPQWQPAIFWAVALLIYPALYIRLRHRSSRPWLTLIAFILLGHLTMSFNIMKQYIAASFIFLALDDFITKKYRNCALWFLVAFAFHFSALFYLPFLPVLRRWRPSHQLLAAAVALGLIIPLLVPQILSLPFLAGFKRLGWGPGTKIGAWLVSGVMILAVWGLLLLRGRLVVLDQRNRFYLCLAIYSVIFSVGSISNIFMARLVPPFQYGLCLLIPEGINCLDRRWRGFATFFILCLLLVWYTFYTLSYGRVVPYQTYLGN